MNFVHAVGEFFLSLFQPSLIRIAYNTEYTIHDGFISLSTDI